MAGLTQPLEFRRFIKTEPRPGFDWVPFIDAILIVLFVAMNISAFVIAPGTTIQLPTSSTLEAPSSSPSAVLTVDRNQLFFFEGAKLSEQTLQEHLEAFAAEARQAMETDGDVTLLIKADASIPASTLFKLMDLAREAGFDRIHLAAEPAGESPGDGYWSNAFPE